MRASGRVKWYDAERGHGFLTVDTSSRGSQDVFVHQSAIHGSGLTPLTAGDAVEFDVVESDLGPAAEGVLRTR